MEYSRERKTKVTLFPKSNYTRLMKLEEAIWIIEDVVPTISDFYSFQYNNVATQTLSFSEYFLLF